MLLTRHLVVVHVPRTRGMQHSREVVNEADRFLPDSYFVLLELTVDEHLWDCRVAANEVEVARRVSAVSRGEGSDPIRCTTTSRTNKMRESHKQVRYHRVV